MTSVMRNALVLLCGLWVCCCTAAGAADVPPGWPWRGVVMNGWGEGEHDIQDVARIKSVGANAIELVLNARQSSRYEHLKPDAAWQKSLAWADRMLDACKQQGMTGIVTFVDVPVDPALNIKQDDPGFWDDATMRSQAVRLAGELAAHFKDRGQELGAYELLNEPVVNRLLGPSLPAEWPTLRQAIVKEIRKHDPSRFVIVTAGIGGLPGGYRNFKPLNEPRIIYGAHVYEPHDFTHQGIGGRPVGINYPGHWQSRPLDKSELKRMLAPLIEFQAKFGALVFIGEFSAVRWARGANQYVSDLTDIFDDKRFAWMYYNYNGWHGWSPFYDEQFSTDHDRNSHLIGNGASRWTLLTNIFRKAALSH